MDNNKANVFTHKARQATKREKSCFVRELVFKGKKVKRVKKADAVRREKRKGKSEKSNCLFLWLKHIDDFKR